MRTKADDLKRKTKRSNPELDAFKAEILKVLEYYAEKKHYEPFVTLDEGIRGPGVLPDGGDAPRRSIAKHWPDEADDNRAGGWSVGIPPWRSRKCRASWRGVVPRGVEFG